MKYKFLWVLVVYLITNNLMFGQDKYDLTIEPHVFRTESGETVNAELGKFYVTENRKMKTGKRIQLAFVRLPVFIFLFSVT